MTAPLKKNTEISLWSGVWLHVFTHFSEVVQNKHPNPQKGNASAAPDEINLAVGLSSTLTRRRKRRPKCSQNAFFLFYVTSHQDPKTRSLVLKVAPCYTPVQSRSCQSGRGGRSRPARKASSCWGFLTDFTDRLRLSTQNCMEENHRQLIRWQWSSSLTDAQSVAFNLYSHLKKKKNFGCCGGGV